MNKINFRSIIFTCAIIIIFNVFSCTDSDNEPIIDPDQGMEPDTTTQVGDTTIVHYDLNLSLLGSLPFDIEESSGLAFRTSTTYWTHNDHGDKAKLYLIDDAANRIGEFEINNSKNEDWEDLASDPSGNLFVADTGNNNNDREDLRIYIVPNSILNNADGDAQVINVVYEDQTAYPPDNDELNYDAEAIIYLDNHIYIFTKDRTKPFLGTTRLYKLEATAGNQSAKFLAEFDTVDLENEGAITGASINSTGDKIAIVSNTKMWVFKNFEDEDFFGYDIDIFTFNTNSEIEAVAFVDDCMVVLSDERKGDQGGNLYNADICR